jgi:hypothetical protein
MELHQYKNLLDQVNAINTRYKKINELTGENFNVFRILKLESSEVRMHSAFLAELLNPKGTHGQKDVFLKLFVEAFCFKKKLIETENCAVEIEKHTGFLNETQTEGGRIDIFITDRYKNHIVIENKIYAGDQKNQLVRYHKYSPNSNLIYLTLFGTEPSIESRGILEIDNHYKCCSYTTDIYNWLEKCRKEVTILPILRESITQYLNLIKYLTNQTINDTMNEELSTIIISNLEASFLIADNLDNSLLRLINKLTEDLNEVASELGLGFSINLHKEFKKNHTGFWFYGKKWKHLNIAFQFQNYDKKMIFGIQTKTDPVKNAIPDTLRNSLASIVNEVSKPNSWWAISKDIEDPFNDWSKYEVWRKIEDGSMKSFIKDKVEQLLKLTEDIKL